MRVITDDDSVARSAADAEEVTAKVGKEFGVTTKVGLLLLLLLLN